MKAGSDAARRRRPAAGADGAAAPGYPDLAPVGTPVAFGLVTERG